MTQRFYNMDAENNIDCFSSVFLLVLELGVVFSAENNNMLVKVYLEPSTICKSSVIHFER